MVLCWVSPSQFVHTCSESLFKRNVIRSHNFTPSAWGILVRGEKNAAAKAAKMPQRTSAERKAAEKKARDTEPHISVRCDVGSSPVISLFTSVYYSNRLKTSNWVWSLRFRLMIYLVLRGRPRAGRSHQSLTGWVTVVCPGFVAVASPPITSDCIIFTFGPIDAICSRA
jgi:hypothetical protein